MANYQEWIVKAPWFAAQTPANAKSASVEFGSGTNGKVTIVYDKKGTDGNAYSVEVVVAEENSAPLAASLNGKKLTVSLATNSGGTADDTKNTAKLISAAINTISGFIATYSGTGATAISAAVAESELEGGQYGTACIEANTVIKGSEYYYICTQGGDSVSAQWKRFSLADY